LFLGDLLMSYDLTKKVYIVTGAGTGIGAATTKLLLLSGASVALLGRSKDTLLRTCENFSGANYHIIEADISKEKDVEKSTNLVIKHFGRLDGSFNNAGIFGNFTSLHDESIENINQVVNTNIIGTLLCMKYQIKALLDFEGGSIVNCASLAAHLGHSASVIYSASKHAILGMSKSAALQYSRQGIRVNSVSPGSTDTEMLRSIYPDQSELNSRAERAPLGRLGEPDEVAEAVVWLLSSKSSYITGQVIPVDGGVLAGTAVNRKRVQK
jgi:A-factor type gamma-butyrolactone 1'-reductase (1S-forming)